MKSEKRIILFFLVFLFITGIVAIAQEQITLTTYYPSPRGEYETVRFVPNTTGGGAEGAVCPASSTGLMYYRGAPDNLLLYCDGATGTWTRVGGAGYWTQTGSDLYPNDANWYVGIGPAAIPPAYPLTVDGGAGFAIRGEGDLAGMRGVGGTAASGSGVDGMSLLNIGVSGYGPNYGVVGDSIATGIGVRGGDVGAPPNLGVWGIGTTYGVVGDGGSYGVYGQGVTGVSGDSTAVGGYGVHGTAPTYGVRGEATGAGVTYGVEGVSSSTAFGSAGVYGTGPNNGVRGVASADFGYGVIGVSSAGTSGYGVWGESNATSFATGVEGVSSGIGNNQGVRAVAIGGTVNTGVWGIASSTAAATNTAIFGETWGGTTNRAIHGKVSGSGTNWAGYFEGGILTTAPDAGLFGRRVYPGDIAELIPTAKDVEAGDIVIVNPDKEGELIRTDQPYDEKVAGVISEKPWFSLGDKEKANQEDPGKNYQHITLAGQVECKVDASYGEIKPGDWLTTSPTPGHAMVVKDKSRAHGTVIGKALQGLKEGKGKILILAKIG